MLQFNIEEKLITAVNRLSALRCVEKQALEVFYTDEIGDKCSLPTDERAWKPFAEPYTLFQQEKY